MFLRRLNLKNSRIHDYFPFVEAQQWQVETDEKQEVFRNMDDELKTARAISERMFKVHNERDFDLDWHKERADQLSERWHNIHSQVDSRSVHVVASLAVFVSAIRELPLKKLFSGFETSTESANPCSTTEIRTVAWINGSEKWKRCS